jgi:hypothetical protein
MDEIFLSLSTFERLLINSLCLISSTIIHYICSIWLQLGFLIRSTLLHLPARPHPFIPSALLRDQVSGAEPEEMSPLMAGRRHISILKLIEGEKAYQKMIELLDEVYRPDIESALPAEFVPLFFDDLLPLPEVSVRLYIFLNEEQKNTAQYAQIGKVFIDQIDDLRRMMQFMVGNTERQLTCNHLVHTDKAFKKVLAGLQRRNDFAFTDLIAMPLQQLSLYGNCISEILKYTPESHPDHKFLMNALDQLQGPAAKAHFSIEDAKRRIVLLDIERKIRKCPPLVDNERKYVGNWSLAEDKVFAYVFTDMIMVLQQKVEIFTRKEYYVSRKEIKLEMVADVVREKNGVKLKMNAGGDIALILSLKGDEFCDAIRNQLPPK